jgi:hypothetical protein
MSYAEMSTPDLMDAGYRAHATITELQRVYAGPGPVSDARLARAGSSVPAPTSPRSSARCGPGGFRSKTRRPSTS